MTEEISTSAHQNTNSKPYLLGYTVKSTGDSGKACWSKIGVAWAHGDGEGYNVRMDALPVDGKLVLRTVPVDHDQTGELFDDLP